MDVVVLFFLTVIFKGEFDTTWTTKEIQYKFIQVLR